MSEREFTWYQFTPIPKPKRWREWMGQIGVCNDGTVFIPAATTGKGDMEVLLCAGFDGTPIVKDKRHLLVPADWVKREFPQSAELVDKILSHVNKTPGGGSSGSTSAPAPRDNSEASDIK